MVRSLAAQWAFGPVEPNGVIEVDDEGRVQRSEVIRPEAPCRHAAGIERLDEHIGPRRQSTQVGPALFGVEVEHDRTLAPVVAPEEQRVLTVVGIGAVHERPEPAGRGAARRFDEDHLGAEEGEDLATQLATLVGQIEDTECAEHRRGNALQVRAAGPGRLRVVSDGRFSPVRGG